ncbi:hypothetical protein B1748_28820 [Paenibacillus sp. MY03]|nr:hypothetical protein B1748_28820 [Paenibacillus sp. MY03]
MNRTFGKFIGTIDGTLTQRPCQRGCMTGCSRMGQPYAVFRLVDCAVLPGFIEKERYRPPWRTFSAMVLRQIGNRSLWGFFLFPGTNVFYK